MLNKSLKIAVVGIGGIGGLLAALFEKNHFQTTAVSSKHSVNQINRNGLNVSSAFFGSFNSKPIAMETLKNDIDIVFFTTKYPYLKESFNRIEKSKIGNPIFISLLNGIGNREIIINNFGNNFVTGNIGSIQVHRDEEGIIYQELKQAPVIGLSKEEDVSEGDFKDVIDVIESVGISTTVFPSYEEVIWSKLVRLGALSSATAAFQKTIGEIRNDDFMREILLCLIEEGSLVANSVGVSTDKFKVEKQIDELPYDLTTSLSRDIFQRSPSELESITMAIIKTATENRIATPNYENILKIILEKYEQR